MSGGGENEDRVQKGKALRFTGPSSQNATMKQDTFLRLFFSFNQKHSFSEKNKTTTAFMQGDTVCVCRDVQKYNNPQADYCLFCVYASFFKTVQFPNVICFCLSLKMAEDHVCTCARGFAALQGESMFMQCVEFDEFPHLNSSTRLFYMDASVSVCYDIYMEYTR